MQNQQPIKPESAESSAPSGDPPAADAEAKSETAEPVVVAQRIKLPRPEKSKIDKCVKEWQVGANRVNQLVSWLCDPFGDSDVSGDAPAVLTSMPAQKHAQGR